MNDPSPVWLRDTGWGSAPERLWPPSLGHKGQWAASSPDQTRPGLYGLNLAQSQGEQEVIFRFWGPVSCGVSWSGIQSQLCLLWGVTLTVPSCPSYSTLHPPPRLLSAFPSVLHIHPPSDFDLSFHLSFPTTHPLLTSLVLGETRIKGRRICLATSRANTDVFHNNDHHVFRNMWGLGVAQKHSTCLACKDPEFHPQHQFLSYWKCI